LIDSDGKKIEANTEFLFGDDATFQSGLEARIRAAYRELFNDFGDDAFRTDRAALAVWFRTTDKTTELVGGRQAATFLILAAVAGHGEPPTADQAKSSRSPKKKAVKPATKASEKPVVVELPNSVEGRVDEGVRELPLGLTVRVEVTLPANGTPEVYDSIFASVRKHLIDRA
jgi:hypothetical protein